jgi:hypothetical protein
MTLCEFFVSKQVGFHALFIKRSWDNSDRKLSMRDGKVAKYPAMIHRLKGASGGASKRKYGFGHNARVFAIASMGHQTRALTNSVEPDQKSQR